MARLLLMLILSTPSMAEEILQISPGHQKVISAKSVIRASIGNPEIADVKDLRSSNQVIVTAKSLGNTDLILWNEKGEKTSYVIEVTNQKAAPKEEILALLRKVEGVKVSSVRGRTVLTGTITRAADIDRVQHVLELYPSTKNSTRIDPKTLRYLVDEIERRFAAEELLTITARGGGNKIFIEGSALHKSDRERAELIAKMVFPNIINKISTNFAMQPLLLVDVKLMEVKTSSLGQIGAKWPSQLNITGSTVLNGRHFSTSANLEDATLTLSALLESGAAKILSNPKLLVRSGTPATFLAGGEIPIRIVGERVASVQFKRYGLELNVNAKTDASRQVFMDIETKISDLDPANAVEGIPGILEHQLKTATNLKFGETVVLGGLIENRTRKNVQKLPLLGQIPILGELFKSRDFQRNQSDFLVFMTPLPTGQLNSSRQVSEMKKRVDEVQKKIDLSILD